MDQDDVLSVSVKLRGLGYLLMQEQINSFPEDFREIREGIGLLVLDLGRRLADLATETERAVKVTAPAAPAKSKRKAVRS
jgi:hypothetical protein